VTVSHVRAGGEGLSVGFGGERVVSRGPEQKSDGPEEEGKAGTFFLCKDVSR